MTKISISDQYQLQVEKTENDVRLVILDGGQEWVSRKECNTVLQTFLTKKEGRIFKGRLQLEHDGEQIRVLVKNEFIGAIHSQSLSKLLKD